MGKIDILKWLKGARGQRVVLVIFVIAAIVYFMPGNEITEGTAEAKSPVALQFGEDYVILYGVAAPDPTLQCTRDGTATPCILAAIEELGTQVKGRTVTCQPVRSMQFTLPFGRCSADGLDLARHMTREGWVVTALQYTDEYLTDEVTAREAGIGIWATNETAYPE